MNEINIFDRPFTGRPQPIRFKEGIHVPDRSNLAREKSLFHGMYPSSLKTDTDKYEHLKDLRDKEEITMDIFLDLVEILNVPKKMKENGG